LVLNTTVVRVRATPLIRFNALMVVSSAAMSVTRTFST
jgi:hypothetical protein